MRTRAPFCQILMFVVLCASVALAAPPASPNAQGPATTPSSFRMNEHGITFQYPNGWSVEHQGKMYRLVRTTPDQLQKLTAADREGLATITTSVETRKSHAEALQRLREIAAESGTPSTFLTIGGWPALQRSEVINKPQLGQEGKPVEEPGTLVHVTTAIAAGATLFRMDGFVDEKKDGAVAREMQTIGGSASFSSAGVPLPQDTSSEVQGLKQAAPVRTVIPPGKAKSSPKPSPQSSLGAKSPLSGAAGSVTTGLAFNLQIGTEPEIVVSTDGKNIVVAQGCSYVTSNDGGVTFPFGTNTPHCNGGDASLGFGKSGNFYEATIGPDPACSTNSGICATAINRSTDGGKTFSFLSNSLTCATASCGFGGIPDQEHLAADRFTQTATGDQVYVVIRLGFGYDLKCSTDSGANFGNETTVNSGATDFPRIAVGQDGTVYVVTTNGGNIELDTYSSCANSLTPQLVHQVVASGVGVVTCPVPGLDRCNNGNDLRSPVVAIDDTNASHIYVTYAINTVSGTNENVIVQDSLDGGNTWGGSGRVAQINNSIPTRRFMPWVCSVGGTAYVSWYDRRNAAPNSDDLTDYFAASAALDATGNLAPGTEFQINSPGTSDPQCAGGQTPGSAASWPCGVRSAADASSCTPNPPAQLAGRCWLTGTKCSNPPPTGSGTPCDLTSPVCPSGETCKLAGGVPKYGDYNGNACGAGRFYTIWGSGTPQPNTTTAPGINLFFSSALVCCEPQIQVPAPVSLTACQGKSNQATANVCNTGKADLVVNAINSSSAQVSVVTPSSGFPVVISPDACFPFQVQFQPTGTSGTTNANLTISTNDPVNPSATLQVNGTADSPSINATIVSGGSFGHVCSGSQNNLTLAVTNQSNSCDLVISNIHSTDGNFLTPTVSLPLTLSPDATVPLPITFQPTGNSCSNTTARTGHINITSNDPVNGFLVENVTGIVPCPSINTTMANSGSFGNVCAGTHEDINLQVLNTGECNLNISSITSSNASGFVLPAGTTFPLVLSADANVNIPIRFVPAGVCSNTVPQTSTITINSNDPSQPSRVQPVSGIEGCPTLVLSPQNLTGAFAFPPTVSDPTGNLGCFTDRQISVTNSGICPLNITALTAAPADTFNVINPTVPLTIAPGASPVPITVRFRPTNLTGQLSNAPDQKLGTLTIASNDPVGVDNAAGLCGEPTVKSGIRVLVVNPTSIPVNPLQSLTLSSNGLHPSFSEKLSNVVPATANVCGNTITYHLDNETLAPAGTTGNSPNASYGLTAKNQSTHADMSFTLGQCEMKQIILQVK